MAQSFAMECPATPERVDQCPATPDFIRRPIKSPENTSSSDESTFQNSRVTSGSPPPNCAICLGKCKNKCFTDSCLHQFCFKCLLEWSKVKAECPLCKQSFKSIIHNVKSDDQFEEYLVQSPSNTFPDFSRPMRAHIQIPSRSSFNTPMQLQSSPLSNSIIQLRSNISTRFRRYVYDGNLFALPLPDVTGRFRDCSARFYRENISQVHRLMPWLNRELVCLLRDTNYTTSTVLCMMHDLLTIFNINSPDFRRRVAPYLGHHTSHFIHEFLNFARSPYDMIGYDREVRYTITSNEGEVIINGTSSSSDSDDIAEIAGESPQLLSELYSNRRQRNNNAGLGLTIEATNNSHSSVSTVHIIIGDGDSNGSNNSNISGSIIPNQASQLTAINLSTNHNSSNIPNNETDNQHSSELRILNETPIEITETNQPLRHISEDRISLHSSASSDACEFVLERKPPHLRTPEMVSLNSDSDSDVVFVSEQKKSEGNASIGPTPGTSGVSFNIGRQTKSRSSRMKNIRGIFMPSSDIDHSSDSDFKPPTETGINRRKKLRTRQLERMIKAERNGEPSTSSGITGTGKPMSLLYSASSSHNKRQKHTSSKPKNIGYRNRPCSGRGYKAIYESSSSSETESSRHESDDDDHKSSSSDEQISSVTKSVSNSTSTSSNTSSSICSSSSNYNSSDRSRKHKNKTNGKSHHKLLNNRGNGVKAPIRSSSSSSTNSLSPKMKVNQNKSRSSSSSSSSNSSSTSKTTSSSSSSSKSSSGSSISSSTASTNSITPENTDKCYKSLRKTNAKLNKHRPNGKPKVIKKSKSDKSHSTYKKNPNSTKSSANPKREKQAKSKSKGKSNHFSKNREHKSKKLKDKDRKRKLCKREKPSTTEFSESDAEPLSKHIKIFKSEPVSNENEHVTSEINSIESDSILQTTHPNEQNQSLEQEQDPTSVLLCFPNNVYLPMNLSTTEQIQNEQPFSPLTSNNAQENSHVSEEHI